VVNLEALAALPSSGLDVLERILEPVLGIDSAIPTALCCSKHIFMPVILHTLNVIIIIIIRR
jgi:hypothetical protein